MTPQIKELVEREELIRDHWKRWRARAEKPLKDEGVFRIHIQGPVDVRQRPDMAQSQINPPLEFRLEHGWYEGEQATRVVCEGITLEIGKRALKARTTGEGHE